MKDKFHILVVDDDKNTRLYLRAVLENAGYTVTTATDGEDALREMDRNHVDLIILDVMMPNMDGYTFTRTLRETQNNLPILMISAKQLPVDKHKGFEAGTDDYITKPINNLTDQMYRLANGDFTARLEFGPTLSAHPAKPNLNCSGPLFLAVQLKMWYDIRGDENENILI